MKSQIVPVLKASDIIREKLDSKDGRKHCLVGWVIATFGVSDNYFKAMKRLRAYIRKRYVYLDVSQFSDTVPKAEVAQAWNDVMREWGYNVYV